MFTSIDELRTARWATVVCSDDDDEGETRAGDPVHMAASGRGNRLVNRAPRLITRACLDILGRCAGLGVDWHRSSLSSGSTR
jgi:hypothetical protein